MRAPARTRPHSFHGDLGNESPMVFRASELGCRCAILAPCETIMAEIGSHAGLSFCELRRSPGASPSGVHPCDDAPFLCEFTLCPSIADNSLPDLYVAGAWHGVSAASGLPGSGALKERQYHGADRATPARSKADFNSKAGPRNVPGPIAEWARNSLIRARGALVSHRRSGSLPSPGGPER